MKFLEHIRVVQFFLYEKQDIRLSEITGIFGPNACGKSSMLDAVQIAMLGANTRLIALNAQADEHKTTRSLRAYCLGQYGESPDHRVRENATTYITLVWRDAESSEPTSMGVCLYASADREGHEILGRYLIRGINLKMGDHLEIVDGKERPRQWSTFRHELVKKSKTTGEEMIFPDSERYIRAVLLALRGSGAPPSQEAFTRAFRFALRMRFDKSVDEIVRNDVLESRPTNIKKFKDVTESFRMLAERVSQVEAKIADGERVAAEYSKAAQESQRAVMWGVLSKLATVELLTESLSKATQAKEDAEKTLEALTEEHLKISSEISAAKFEAKRFREQREAHSAHKDYGALQTAINTANEKIKEKRQEILTNLSLVSRTLNDASKFDVLKSRSAEIQTAVDSIIFLEDQIDSLTKELIETKLRPALNVAQIAAGELQVHETMIAHELNEAKRKLEISKSALARIKEGRAPLDGNVQQLLTELRDHGLNPIPVCDLVRITEPSWQPVIESYLGPNVQALLVPADQEADAFKVYRGLSGKNAVYGAKIARESRQQGGRIPERGSVAELIEGDNPAAVAYLRRQFGNILCAVDDIEALRGHRTLTKDGMLSGIDIERLYPVAPNHLRIGAGGRSYREAVQKEYNALLSAVQSIEKTKKTFSDLLTALRNIANKDLVTKFILNTWYEMYNSQNEAAAKTKLMKDAADEEYVMLGNAEQEWESKASQLEPRKEELLKEIGTAANILEGCKTAEQQEQARRELAYKSAEEAQRDPQYDHDFGLRQWDIFLEKHEMKYQSMVDYFDKQQESAKKRMGIAINSGAKELGIFLEKYREQAPQEITVEWIKAREWLLDLLKRLNDTQLVPFKEEMDAAYRTSQETFRNDVAIALNNNLEWLEETLSRLNTVLRECPAFSMGERYRFRREVRPKFASLLKFVKDVAAYGPTEDLFGGPGAIPEEFRQLLEDKITPGSAGVPSPLDDYREFFEFDIEILREDPVSKTAKVVGHLSKRIGPGSGGEHRAPLYVIAGAALASAYRLDRGNIDGLRLIVLDEAFNKMDMTNIIATMRYLEQLNLQVFMASPGENLGTLTAFLHLYYDILRDADNNTIMLEGHDVSPEARIMFREDLPEFNPILVEQQLAAMRAASSSQIDQKSAEQ